MWLGSRCICRPLSMCAMNAEFPILVTGMKTRRPAEFTPSRINRESWLYDDIIIEMGIYSELTLASTN